MKNKPSFSSISPQFNLPKNRPLIQKSTMPSLADLMANPDNANIKIKANKDRDEINIEYEQKPVLFSRKYEHQEEQRIGKRKQQSPFRFQNKQNIQQNHKKKSVHEVHRFANCIKQLQKHTPEHSQEEQSYMTHKTASRSPISSNKPMLFKQESNNSFLPVKNPQNMQEDQFVFKAKNGVNKMNFGQLAELASKYDNTTYNTEFAPKHRKEERREECPALIQQQLTKNKSKSKLQAPKIQKQFQESEGESQIDNDYDKFQKSKRIREQTKADQFQHIDRRIHQLKDEKIKLFAEKKSTQILPKAIEEMKSNAAKQIEEFAKKLLLSKKDQPEEQKALQQYEIQRQKIVEEAKSHIKSYAEIKQKKNEQKKEQETKPVVNKTVKQNIFSFEKDFQSNTINNKPKLNVIIEEEKSSQITPSEKSSFNESKAQTKLIESEWPKQNQILFSGRLRSEGFTKKQSNKHLGLPVQNIENIQLIVSNEIKVNQLKSKPKLETDENLLEESVKKYEDSKGSINPSRTESIGNSFMNKFSTKNQLERVESRYITPVVDEEDEQIQNEKTMQRLLEQQRKKRMEEEMKRFQQEQKQRKRMQEQQERETAEKLKQHMLKEEQRKKKEQERQEQIRREKERRQQQRRLYEEQQERQQRQYCERQLFQEQLKKQQLRLKQQREKMERQQEEQFRRQEQQNRLRQQQKQEQERVKELQWLEEQRLLQEASRLRIEEQRKRLQDLKEEQQRLNKLQNERLIRQQDRITRQMQEQRRRREQEQQRTRYEQQLQYQRVERIKRIQQQELKREQIQRLRKEEQIRLQQQRRLKQLRQMEELQRVEETRRREQREEEERKRILKEKQQEQQRKRVESEKKIKQAEQKRREVQRIRQEEFHMEREKQAQRIKAEYLEQQERLKRQAQQMNHREFQFVEKVEVQEPMSKDTFDFTLPDMKFDLNKDEPSSDGLSGLYNLEIDDLLDYPKEQKCKTQEFRKLSPFRAGFRRFN